MSRIGIVGTGVAGIFCAIELINNGFDGKDIVMFEKGKPIDKRKCFVTADTPCKKCKICSISSGCGGAGSFSDSKLNFDPTGKVGGDMAELMTQEEITEYLKKTYEIYKQFGIEEFQSKIYGKDYTKEAQEIIDIIKENPNMEISECITIHLGSENSRIIYGRMLDFLEEHRVRIISECEITEITTDDFNNKIWYKHKDNYSLYGHVLTYEEFDKITDMVAYTEFDSKRYCATAEQVENNDLYIIDPKGVDFFMKAYKGSKTPKIIFISSNLTTRYERMVGRAETKGKSHQEAIESSLTRIVNDAGEFYDYIQGQAWVDYVCKNNSNDKLEDIVDKIFDYISSCESEVR